MLKLKLTHGTKCDESVLERIQRAQTKFTQEKINVAIKSYILGLAKISHLKKNIYSWYN